MSTRNPDEEETLANEYFRMSPQNFVIFVTAIASLVAFWFSMDGRIAAVDSGLQAHLATAGAEMTEIHRHEELPGHPIELERLGNLKDRVEEAERHLTKIDQEVKERCPPDRH